MFDCFGLVLTVNHACNLRCRYCYTGAKFHRSMTREIALKSIDRAAASLSPGGMLELGFFGGEPLLEGRLILDALDYAGGSATAGGFRLDVGLTTNGTLTDDDAMRVLHWPGMRVNVSHDGLPEVHDAFRPAVDGKPTAAQVIETVNRLLRDGVDVRVTMVVHPGSVRTVPEGIEWLRRQRVRRVDLSLDLWSTWQRSDAGDLRHTITRCADVWRDGLPDCSINWFDEKATMLAGVPCNESSRCGYGHGEIAVAPSGNLYPCERVIGEDTESNTTRLPGHALDGDDFLLNHNTRDVPHECSSCAILDQCSTKCRCSNFIRTGDVNRPDGLLCLVDQYCLSETRRVLDSLTSFSLPQFSEVSL